ncbi:MAG: hypothetical protein D8M57_13205 [Candidatus Scalindua sp. AMX11]|nr:MAG: hypothetical protein DWQ00_11885 [Candidatus Scalindua sp.]NOG83767.1 hypothetical protein [Planctomycetota bacterium]RZV82926.1 MAG: hypothetical protein EX341_09040 [Candidatus Scalindua sp. SCAELEC01]TDE64452.1 MAG: hypothetical protein D8M57_13205 [Candidatus Scalindua sp. AMX11]GJQ59781.1 MAG: hypothetical protein SCALA701_25820 [Candidatus Scalindua sp.]
MRTEGNLTFTANVALTQGQRVKIKSGSTTSPIEVELAGAGEGYIGTVLAPAAAAAVVAVRPRNDVGSHEMVASGAISAGTAIYGAASGKISSIANGAQIGTAIEAATADGDIIEVLPFHTNDRNLSESGASIATTGDTDEYVIAPMTGKLTQADFSSLAALAANDTNYVTFSITNLGQDGTGTDAMLAAVDGNTTKATGGAAIAANTKRTLTLHGTAANLNVTVGDRLLIRAAATGTLAGAVTKPVYSLHFAA